MKKLAILLTLIFPLFVLSSCDDDFEEITEINLSAVLTPTTTTASISVSDGRTVTFSWSNSTHATQYVIEIYEFETDDAPSSSSISDADLTNLYLKETVEADTDGSKTSYEKRLEADHTYYARVKAQNADDDSQDDSKWAAFSYPIETYTVMDNLLTFEVSERTSSSLTIDWTLAEDDIDGITTIRISPDPDGSSSYKSYDVSSVTAASDGTYSYEITGLDASTYYTIIARYASAARGTILAWTKPSTTNPTQVTDTAGFKQAIRDGATEILVMNDIAPGSVTLVGTDVSIYGDIAADGTLPEVRVSFDVPDVTKFHLEGLSLSGVPVEATATGNYSQVIVVGATLTSVEEISMLNCEVSDYKCGLIYIAADYEITSMSELSFDSIWMTNTEGNGGGVIDLRPTTANVASVVIKNSTFDGGTRDFFRLGNDANAVYTSIELSNNTINSICEADNSNNVGLFNIQANTVIKNFIFKNNLVMNFAENYPVVQSGKYGWGRSGFAPAASELTISNNYYYNVEESGVDTTTDAYKGGTGAFFVPSSTGFTRDVLVGAGVGVVLDEDPCYNSERSIFNVTNSEVYSLGVGDPRWLIDYVAPVDADLEPVDYGYTWDLTDTGVFDATVSSSCVRGNLQFIVESNPINMVESGQEFTAAATFNSKGIPTDCAIAFIVDGPGSVVVSTVADGSVNDHLTVAYTPVAGGDYVVAGAAYAGATREKVVLADLEDGVEYMVYIYGCGPIILSELSWSADVSSGGASLLTTPVVTLSATETTGDAVTLSWDEVDNAASYIVRRISAVSDTTTVTALTNSYSITASSLAFGNYEYSVMAVKSDTDLAHENSEYSEAVTLFRNGTTSTISSTTATSWGAEAFEAIYNGLGSSKYESNFVYSDLSFIAGGGGVTPKISSGEGDNVGLYRNAAGEYAYCLSLAGTTSTSKNALQFTVPGPGTLVVEAGSNGSSARGLNIYIGDTQHYVDTGDPKTTAPANTELALVTTFDLTNETIAAGTVITVGGTGGGINIFSITWTPEGYDPDAATKENYSWGTTDWTYMNATYDTSSTALTSDVTYNGLTYCYGTGGSGFKFSDSRVQLAGAGAVGKTCLQFTVTAPGTLVVNVAAGGSSNERCLEVAVGETVVYTSSALTTTASDVTVDLTSQSIEGSTVISLYSTKSGLNIYSITWTGK